MEERLGNLDVCDSRLDKAGKAEIRFLESARSSSGLQKFALTTSGPFSIFHYFPIKAFRNRKNAANPAFFELDCKLPNTRLGHWLLLENLVGYACECQQQP
jgi:hypothetical protein